MGSGATSGGETELTLGLRFSRIAPKRKRPAIHRDDWPEPYLNHAYFIGILTNTISNV